MQTVVTKKIDELGRLVLPAELRNNLNLEVGDEMDIFTDEAGNIVLKKSMERCILCKGTDKLIKVRDKSICSSCKEIIKQM